MDTVINLKKYSSNLYIRIKKPSSSPIKSNINLPKHFPTKLKYFPMSFHSGDKLHLPFRQQVWTLEKLYREKQCILACPVMSSAPYQLPDLQITQILTTQPFLHAKLCLWDQCLFLHKKNISQLLGAIGSYYITKKHSCFPPNLLGLSSPAEICVLV